MNLRKDYCQNLHSRTTHEVVLNTGGGTYSSRASLLSPEARKLFGRPTNPGVESAKEYYNHSPPNRTPFADRAGGSTLLYKHK